jgi:hypothetical protein
MFGWESDRLSAYSTCFFYNLESIDETAEAPTQSKTGTRIELTRYTSRKQSEEIPMSDPREIERDPNLPRNRYVGRNDNSGWIIAGVIVVILLGVAAFSYRGEQMTSSSPPATTSGQSTRAPVPTTPPATPVAPAQPPQ